MHRWDPLYDEYYRPRGDRRKAPKPARKRKPYYKKPRFSPAYLPPDIDMMKPETLGGRFCGCGARQTETCQRCLSFELDSRDDM